MMKELSTVYGSNRKLQI